MDEWPFGALERGKYGLILADCPWSFTHFSSKGHVKSAQAHYDCMSQADLKALPVADLAAPDCALVMWATAPMLPHAVDLMGAWGFAYKSAGAWAKRSKSGAKWAFGTGYVFRSASEFFLVGTRGKPVIGNRSTRNLIVAPVRDHSRKPCEMHDMLEKLFPCEHRCELFARQSRPGWTVWGNQATHFDGDANGVVEVNGRVARCAGASGDGVGRRQNHGDAVEPV